MEEALLLRSLVVTEAIAVAEDSFSNSNLSWRANSVEAGVSY